MKNMRENPNNKMLNQNFKNEIISENKFQRKKALEHLIKEINEEQNQEKCQEIFNEYQVYILKCFRDESEMCRELSMDLLLTLIKRLSLNDYYLTYIFPVIVERVGTPEIVEESEELRLKIIEFVKEIITVYSGTEFLVPFLNDIIEVLVHSLLDKHPKVKISCCQCILETAKALPKHFHMQCENLIKSLLKAFTHQQFRVRVIAVEACGEIIMHGSYNALENTVTQLAERLFDQIPQVRQAVIRVAAKLLTEYRDRYSFFHKILPLILTGLTDEIPETRNIAEILWTRVGDQYTKENESDLKDQLDFTENLPFDTKYPRPNIGCRTVVQRNVSKIIPALCRELSTTWQDDIKIRCGQLLTALILHCEENFTQNLQDVFPAMFAVCQKDDNGSESLIKAAELIGLFIPPQTWFKFISEVLNSNINYGHLRVIRAILTGCRDISQIRCELASLLGQRHICHVRNSLYQRELIECCSLLSKDRNESEFDLAVICATVLGLSKENEPKLVAAEELLEKCWLKSGKNGEVCEAILNTFTVPPIAWTSVTTDRLIFDFVLRYSKNVINLESNLVLTILQQCLCESEEAEAKILTYINLANCIERWNRNKSKTLESFYQKIASDIILPNLIWHAGRSREAIRTVSSQCLCNILESGPYEWIRCDDFISKLVPLLVSLLEDNQKHTRAYSIRCVSFLSLPNLDIFIKVYQLLLSRLDDEFDVARLVSVEALKHIFENLPSDFHLSIFKPHFEHTVDTLLVHLEDEDSELKKELMETLKVVAKIDNSYVLNKMASMQYLLEEGYRYEDFVKDITS